MANAQLEPVLHRLRHLFQTDQPDAILLERFVTARDESAFELLMLRHGAMVLGLCRGILRHAHDAEDAFQATFLTLVRKAGAIGKREAVGSWLYKVAYRIALRARRASNQQRQEKQELFHTRFCLAQYSGSDLERFNSSSLS